MSNVFIGIGGSGAKVLESLTHICGLGIGPEVMMPLMVDPDHANGNMNRTKALLAQYVKCRQKLELVQNQSRLLRTDISFPREENGQRVMSWSPTMALNCDNLTSYFGYNLLKNDPQRPELGAFCDMLYTQTELDLNWGRGFHGRPSIGAPVMAHAATAAARPPWSELMQFLKEACGSNRPAKVFIVGSIFGATGASGFPTLARVIRNAARREKWTNADKLYIGGALLLPYFAYQVPPGSERVFARPENFMVNTAAALKYYAEDWKRNTGDGPLFDAVYLLGNQELDMKGQAETREGYDTDGGDHQTNMPHFVEFYAAIAANEFFRRWQTTDEARRLREHEIGRRLENAIEWRDVPGAETRQAILSLTTLAYAYLGFYDPLIADKLETKPRLIPWYVDKFRLRELESEDSKEAREILKAYLRMYLEWLREVHRTTSRTVKLINRTVLRLDQEAAPDFGSLLPDELFRAIGFRDDKDPDYNPKYTHGYDALWDQLNQIACEESRDVPLTGQAMGKFLYLLHSACMRFCEQNYGGRAA